MLPRIVPLAVSLTRKASPFLQKFFACTVWAFATRTVKNVNHVEWNSLHFSFPAAMKRMLGDHAHSWPTTLFEKDVNRKLDASSPFACTCRAGSANLKRISVSEASGNKIANCTFFGGEADPLLEVQGAGMIFEDVRLT